MRNRLPDLPEQRGPFRNGEFQRPQDGLDRTLADLDVANISRAIAEGSLVGQAQLGMAIGLVLRRERQD